ncbi:MAG TPA: hypothetical protein VLJ37_05650 [bacterium]|nr:hypothetical protein [bacterium]
MRRILSFTLVAAFLFLAPAAQADEALCPMMTLKHSKELGLSKKQTAEIEKIRDQMMESMRSAKMKASEETRGVLTAKQIQKAEKLDMGCPMMKGGGCPGMKGGRDSCGGDCPMRD